MPAIRKPIRKPPFGPRGPIYGIPSPFIIKQYGDVIREFLNEMKIAPAELEELRSTLGNKKYLSIIDKRKWPGGASRPRTYT